MKFSYRPLSDFADVKGGKRLPKGINLITDPNTHPYIRVRDLGVKTLELTPDFEYVDNETQCSISRYIVNYGDIIISIVGTIGLVAQIGVSLDGANLTENCAKIVNINGLDKNFLYYYLSSNDGQNVIKAATVGAVQAKLPLKNILDLPIPNLPLSDQRAIATILSCLDEKIANNAKVNHHLEQMAQAIFKSWFVDFEPWGDDEFVESEIKPIPKGWQIIKFSSFLSPRIEKSNDPNIELFSVTDNGIFPRDEKFKKNLSSTNTKNKIVRQTDLVFGMSREILNWGIMRSKIGGVSSAYNIFAVDNRINSRYLESFIKSYPLYFKDLIRPASREGQSVDKGALMLKSIYLPPDNILAKYYEIENSLIEGIQANLDESTRLATIRDALLPRLMSGELSVADIGEGK